MGAWDPKRRVIEVENGLNRADELMVLAHEYGHSLGFGRARDADADTFTAEFLRQTPDPFAGAKRWRAD